MTTLLKRALLACVVMAASALVAQNGPTQYQVLAKFTQSTMTGVTANCIYRSTGAATKPVPPALYCSTTPITSYTDTTVAAGTTYVYAVTAKVGTAESGYSALATAPVPANPSAPTGPTTTTTTITITTTANQ